MEMNRTVKIVIVLLFLAFPNTAYTDYYYRPTARPPVKPQMRDTSPRNRYSAISNETYVQKHMEARSTNGQRKEHDDVPIVYPDGNVKTVCTHGLCENVAGYPKDQIQTLLSRSSIVRGYFDVSEEIVSITNRFNPDEMSMCETKVHTIYPEKANNTMKVEKVIVNVDGYKQGIVFETCVNNGKCKFSSNFPSGYTSYCKQKYIHKKLMVLGDNDKFVFDSFEVPSCCVCTVSRT